MGESTNSTMGFRGFIRGVFQAFMLVMAAPSMLFAAPLSLGEACRQARIHDAQVRIAETDLSISKEEVSKAGSAFRPSIMASSSIGRNRTESITPFSPDGSVMYYGTSSSVVSLRQGLFNMEDIAAYRQARAGRAKSESLLRQERSSLLIRTAEAYFNVLYSQDNLEFTRSQTRYTSDQLQQARRRYQDGFGTITEISEAEASHDIALAEESGAVTALDFNRHELERLTGVPADRLFRLRAERMQYENFETGKVDDWIGQAMTGNAKLGAARQEILIARREVDKSRAARLPSIDLLAGRSHSVSETNYTIGSTYDTWSIALQVSVPIYTGGHTSAAIRQSQARRLRAAEQCDLTERAVASDVRKLYNGLLDGVVQIKAYERAVRSNEIALEGTRKGFGAGLRSNIDVLNAQRKLLETRRNLARARYVYILDRIMLKDVVGTLTEDDVADIDRWFSDPAQA